jgi:cytidylate kinase
MAIITISRGTLSGGEDLAHQLSQRTGCPAISREVIRDAASQYGISEATLTDHMEKGPRFIERLVGEEKRMYLIAIQAALAERAERGDFIYHGHAGHLLLRGVPNVFKVRLIAPVEYRINRIREKKTIPDEEARRYIENIDKRRIQWTKFLYDVDWRDASLYDVVFNLESITLETACEMILQAISQPEFQDGHEKKKIIENFSMACRIKVKLALNDRTRGMPLDVKVQDGVARIYGKFLSSGPFASGLHMSQNDILEVVRTFPGIEKVEFDIKEAGIPIEV